MSHRISVIRLRAMAAYREETGPSHSMTSSASNNIAEHGRPHRLPHTTIQDQVRRREIEQIMETDPRRYWSDGELQAELFHLLERAP
jgi:hypothetical protein